MRYIATEGIIKRDVNKFKIFGLALAYIVALTTSVFFNANAASTEVVVTPTNTHGWTEGDMRFGGEVNYVEDLSSPYPSGALQIKTDSDPASKAQYMKAESGLLSDVTELGYHSIQNGGPVHANASFQLVVDLNGGDLTTGFSTLVYEPYWQNGLGDADPVLQGVWQEWDVDAGSFWSTRNFTEGTCITVNGAGGPPFYTLADLEEDCPDATVLGIGVNVGTNNPGYDINIDGVAFNDTLYNFELFEVASSKEACKKGGWMTLTDDLGNSFKNQGDCVSYVATGGTNKADV